MKRRSALLLNFTGNTYHWGCFGTSVEIVDSLAERGYYTNHFSLTNILSFAPSPERIEQFDDKQFIDAALRAYPELATSLEDADIVVVNGEGTLHRLLSPARNLLFITHLAAKYFGKPVHLINHSFFPSGEMREDPFADAFYSHVAKNLHTIVPREIYSAAVLSRLGLKAEPGFDCLPRFIVRHGLNSQAKSPGTILISGSVMMSEEFSQKMGKTLRRLLGPDRTFHYLVGAKRRPDPKEPQFFESMRREIPNLEYKEAESIEEWVGEIRNASFLISGRFHHSIAAAMVDTPVIVFPSNTPKIHAACSMMGLDAPIPYDFPNVEKAIAMAVRKAMDGKTPLMNQETKSVILALAGNNFKNIP